MRSKSPWIALLFCLAGTASVSAQTLRAGAPERLPGIVIEHGRFSDSSRDGHILQCVVESTGLTLQWVQYPTARLLKMAAAGELDIVYPLGFDAQRDVDLQRSLFTLKARDLWVFKGSVPDFNDKAHVAVAAKLGSPQQDFLQHSGYKNISLPNSYESLFKMVENQRVAAIAVPEPVLSSMQAQLVWTPQSQAYLERDVGFYVARSLDAAVLERINNAIPACRR